MKYIPKQIIYPINYLGSAGSNKQQAAKSLFIGELKHYLKAPFDPIPIGRARMGIYLLVKTTLTDSRKKVILSAYTIPDVINMVILAGGEPVFVDTMVNSTNIDSHHLETLVDTNVACVLVTHYHVSQNNMSAIYDLCKNKGVRLFEDCAIALGATIDNHHVGLCSDGGILSLSGYKSLNYIWGGAVFTNDSKINDALKLEISGWLPLRKRDYLQQGLRTLRYDVATRSLIFNWLTFPILRFRQRWSDSTVQLTVPRLETHEINNTLTSIPNDSAFGEWLSKLPSLDRNIQHRRSMAAIYDEHLSAFMVARETDEHIKSTSSFINYPISVSPENRHSVHQRLNSAGFDVGLSLYPCCSHNEKFSRIPGCTVNTQRLEQSVITLPTHPRVSASHAHSLSKALKTILPQ